MTTVIHYTPIWLPGTQTWMYNQVRHLPRDVNAHVVCERTENLGPFGVPNIHCLADRPAHRRILRNVLRWASKGRQSSLPIEIARDLDADILHSHFGPIGWANIPVARRASLKHIVTFYGLDVNHLPMRHPRWRQRYLDLFEHVDTVICEGPHMADCIRGLGCPESKVRVQRLGIDLENIAFSPLEWQPGQALRVLIAATFREKKGIPDALEALGRLRHRLPLEVTLIGDAGGDRREQPEKRRIQATIDRLEFGTSIRVHGYLPHARLLELAYRHHVFLSPSVTAKDGDTEGGAPVILIEMSAAGLIPVSTYHCDIPEVVKHRKTGLLANEHDVDGLIRSLEWLVDNPNTWCAMRRAGRRHIEDNFEARTQGQRLAEIYRSLV